MDGFSAVRAQQAPDGNGQDPTLVDLVRAALERDGADAWDLELDDMWCHVHPPGYRSRDQGWKLHVAATRPSAAVVLERSLGVLLRERCAFKFAKSLEKAALLNSSHYPRGGAGKFLTAYPDDDEHFRRVASQLDRATADLSGPTVLSDRPYRPDSLVHYRYGAFAGRTVLTNDGAYEPVLQAPDGTLTEERRDAWFTPPEWAPSPLGEDWTPAPAADQPQSPVPLGDRFVLREAIRHANRGGVYRATDIRTGADVVVKHARPYVEAKEDGWDIRDGLRHEAEMLDALASLGVAPCTLALLEQGGHVFLVEELVPGVPLLGWLAEHADDQPGLSWGSAVRMIRRLVRLLAAVHAVGLVLRDLTPNNVLVDADGELWVVDLELTSPLGMQPHAAGTPGYAAPEQLAGAPVTAAMDLYSLGAIGFLIATGADPALPEDRPAVRSTRARLEHWLAVTGEHNQAAKRLAPLILGLMEEEPERRWGLEHVRAFLDAPQQTPVTTRAGEPGPDSPGLPESDQRRLIEDGLAHLLSCMAPEADWLWPSTSFGATTDACSMHHGAAGVLAVLTQAAGWYRDERLMEALRTACAWIERRLPAEPRLLPGLSFGRSGTAWALYDAGRLLDDEPMTARALELAKRIPIPWPNPDVTHGVAGAGLAQLHLWQATGDPELRERVERCADDLVAAAQREPTGVMWKVPPSFDSKFAGGGYYGFAHGIAGIAWFLLAAGLATGRDDCLELARAAGETLCAAARRDGESATWGEGPGDTVTRMVHWCHGSSGVGTFLIRLWQTTGDEGCRALAEQAAVAVRRGRWYASPVFCHGLAGNAEFLLDMAAALDEPRYRGWAEELAAVIFARRVYRDGRVVVCDDSGTDVSADYGAGLAGVVAFFLRLCHGGPRMWMAEPTAVGAAQC
ncbi:MAG: class IV lanthionine synthetase LanL [Egibacteraceae bacterium]